MKTWFNGLIGLKDNGKTLVSPDGTIEFNAPMWLAPSIQRIQHWIFWKVVRCTN